MNGKTYEGMAYLMNRGTISPPSPQYYNTILQGYRENGLDESYLQKALENSLRHDRFIEEDLDESVQFAKDYIDSEEKEYCRMIDEYGRELEKNEQM